MVNCYPIGYAVNKKDRFFGDARPAFNPDFPWLGLGFIGKQLTDVIHF